MLAEIIKGCRKRSRSSQKELYQKFYGYGMSIALRYADSREQAVIILNDSFLKVFDNIRSYDPSKPFLPWFRRILINTAINQYHKDRKNRELLYLDGSENGLSTDDNIIASLSYQEIIDMVQKLTPGYRTVFNLHVIEGYKHEEIADMLGISVGTSKSNLSKAKRSLRELLERNLKITDYNGRQRQT